MTRRNKFKFAGALLLILISGACSPEAQPTVSPAGTNASQTVAPTPPPPIVTNAVAMIPIQPPTNAAPVQVSSTNVFTPLEARNHIGETVTVRGKVFGVHATAKGDVFINIGDVYPNAPFTAVCFGGAIPAEVLTNLDGKTVSFTGALKEYNGQTEVVLNKADQISQ